MAPVAVEKPVPELPVENECGPHDPALVYQLIRKQGVPRIPAIQLLGSWKTESGGGFNQCQNIGDGGIAHGLNSWHPGRRYDMPLGLEDQIRWAIHVEMKRDCMRCYNAFMNATDKHEARVAIQQSTRWGVEGGRWIHADNFEAQF